MLLFIRYAFPQQQEDLELKTHVFYDQAGPESCGAQWLYESQYWSTFSDCYGFESGAGGGDHLSNHVPLSLIQ